MVTGKRPTVVQEFSHTGAGHRSQSFQEPPTTLMPPGRHDGEKPAMVRTPIVPIRPPADAECRMLPPEQ